MRKFIFLSVGGQRSSCHGYGMHYTPKIKSPALESRSPLMDPVDTTRQGRTPREHHNSGIHVNDHVIGSLNNIHHSSGMHGPSGSLNPLKSPATNPPLPKRHPLNQPGSAAFSATNGSQGKLILSNDNCWGSTTLFLCFRHSCLLINNFFS